MANKSPLRPISSTVGADDTATIVKQVDASGRVVGSSAGSSTATQGAAAVSTSAQVLAANANRIEANLQPTNGDIYVGVSGVTTSTGTKVVSGSLWSESAFTGAIHAVAASGTVDVRYWEV